MEPSQAAQLTCQTCGGQSQYDPQSKGLKCSYCGDEQHISVTTHQCPMIEQPFDPSRDQEPRITISDSAHSCQSCGGKVVFVGPSASTRCPYCNGAVVLTGQTRGYDVSGMIPFQVSRSQAQDIMRDWLGKRIGAPKSLVQEALKGSLCGFYVPFWTIDTDELVTYLVRYKVKRGDNWITRTYRGDKRSFFDDMLVPASTHITPLIRDGILHDFHPEDLRPYDPRFLAGFAAEHHYQSLHEGLALNAADKDLVLRRNIKRHSRKRNITQVTYQTHNTQIRYRRILLPIWLLHYDYQGKAYKVATCGLRGRTYGERPFDRKTLLGFSVALTSLLTVIGAAIGIAALKG